MKEPRTFSEFWPGYLAAHSDPRTRTLHIAGTAVGLACAALYLATFNSEWAVAGLVSAYGAAWVAHALFEKNTPKTFSNPVWSLRGDFRMLRLAVLGRLEEEKRNVAAAAAEAARSESR